MGVTGQQEPAEGPAGLRKTTTGRRYHAGQVVWAKGFGTYAFDLQARYPGWVGNLEVDEVAEGGGAVLSLGQYVDTDKDTWETRMFAFGRVAAQLPVAKGQAVWMKVKDKRAWLKGTVADFDTVGLPLVRVTEHGGVLNGRPEHAQRYLWGNS